MGNLVIAIIAAIGLSNKPFLYNKSNAIVNNNKGAYELAKKRAESAQKQRDEIRSATREINTIKNEMHDIKSMIKTLLDRN